MTTQPFEVIHPNGKASSKVYLTSIEDFENIGEDRPIVEVTVPQWNDAIVLMRAMESIERDEWEYRFVKDYHVEPVEEKRHERDRKVRLGDRLIGSRAQLAARCLVDMTGAPLPPERLAPIFQHKNAAAINLLANEASRLNGFDDEDHKRLEQAKKDNASRDDKPSSDSPGE